MLSKYLLRRKVLFLLPKRCQQLSQLFFSSNTSPKTDPKTQQIDSKDITNELTINGIKKEFQNYGSIDSNIDLDLDIKSGIATIIISNPKYKNSISGQMMTQFIEIIDKLEIFAKKQKGKAVLMMGSNEFFSSGGDLNTVRQINDSDGGRRMSMLMQYNLTRFQSLPLVSVALVQGMAIGGGAELLTACDFRLCSRGARIGFVHIRVGITLAWGGASRLAHIIGSQKALELMLTGRTVDAEEALRLGLIDAIVSEDNSLQESRDWMTSLVRYPSETVLAAKQMINNARNLPLELSLQKEIEVSSSVWGGTAHQKALQNNIKHKNDK